MCSCVPSPVHDTRNDGPGRSNCDTLMRSRDMEFDVRKCDKRETGGFVIIQQNAKKMAVLIPSNDISAVATCYRDPHRRPP